MIPATLNEMEFIEKTSKQVHPKAGKLLFTYFTLVDRLDREDLFINYEGLEEAVIVIKKVITDRYGKEDHNIAYEVFKEMREKAFYRGKNPEDYKKIEEMMDLLLKGEITIAEYFEFVNKFNEGKDVECQQ